MSIQTYLEPFIDEETDRISFLLLIENKTDEPVCISSMTSEVIQWTVMDDDNYQYLQSGLALQAGHSINIDAGKAHKAIRSAERPEEIKETYSHMNHIEYEEIITDPSEIEKKAESPEDFIAEPTIQPESSKELTVTAKFTINNELYEVSEVFIPVELDTANAESLIPDSVTVDEDSSVSLGRF